VKSLGFYADAAAKRGSGCDDKQKTLKERRPFRYSKVSDKGTILGQPAKFTSWQTRRFGQLSTRNRKGNIRRDSVGKRESTVTEESYSKNRAEREMSQGMLDSEKF